jgi:hypothetical protein
LQQQACAFLSRSFPLSLQSFVFAEKGEKQKDFHSIGAKGFGFSIVYKSLRKTKLKIIFFLKFE